MSYILDALKKSEHQRQQQQGATLQTVHKPFLANKRSSRLGIWLGVTVVLLLNVVAVYWFLGREASPIQAELASEKPTGDDAEIQLSEESQRETAAVSSGVTEPETSQPAALQQTPGDDFKSQQSVAEDQFDTYRPSGGIEEKVPRPASLRNSDSAVQDAKELWELPADLRSQFPPLTYSFHVYSENPARRTIIINNRRVSEGAQLSAELSLNEITQDGVILNFKGTRVHISVLQGW